VRPQASQGLFSPPGRDDREQLAFVGHVERIKTEDLAK
jgi:hypothetical protein